MTVHHAGRRSMLAAALASLAACQVPAPPPPAAPKALALGPGNTGYLLLNAPIAAQSAGFLTENMDKLVALGATRIDIAINSPGGVVRYAEAIINAMDRTHAERGVAFTTHNIGVVASAACYVFLAGQRRLANARSSFLFHAAGVAANGVLTGDVLQEASAELQQDERTFANMLKTRTRLTEGEASSFLHRTVILTASEARRDGIIDAIEEFTVPKGAIIAAISTRRPPTPPHPADPPIPPG